MGINASKVDIYEGQDRHGLLKIGYLFVLFRRGINHFDPDTLKPIQSVMHFSFY